MHLFCVLACNDPCLLLPARKERQEEEEREKLINSRTLREGGKRMEDGGGGGGGAGGGGGGGGGGGRGGGDVGGEGGGRDGGGGGFGGKKEEGIHKEARMKTIEVKVWHVCSCCEMLFCFLVCPVHPPISSEFRQPFPSGQRTWSSSLQHLELNPSNPPSHGGLSLAWGRLASRLCAQQ